MSICYPEKMREYPELKAMPQEAAGPLVDLFHEAYMPLFIYLDSLVCDVADTDSALYRCGLVAQSLREGTELWPVHVLSSVLEFDNVAA